MGTISHEKRQAFLNDPNDPRHGKMRGYQLKCRCARCVEAYRTSYERERERRRHRFQEG